MSGKLEEELRDKIKHYENKEKDLIERERLFELRMKEQHEKFTEEKTKTEQELVIREKGLTLKEKEMVSLISS
jgi:acyl-CoA thioesterase